MLVAAALAVAGWLWQQSSRNPDPREICHSLERRGVVSRCRARSDWVKYAVRIPLAATFLVMHDGRHAYSGVLAQFRNPKDLEHFLVAAREEHRRSARKIAAATEIGSEGRTPATEVLADLQLVQARNDRALLAVHLVPLYGGPHPQVKGQVEAIRAALLNTPSP